MFNLEELIHTEWELVLYRRILQDERVGKLLTLIKELTRTIPDKHAVFTRYYDFITAFLPRAAEIAVPGRNAWQDYLLELILREENFFTQQAELRELSEIPAPLRQMAAHDLHCLQKLAQIKAEALQREIAEKTGTGSRLEPLPGWEGIFLPEKGGQVNATDNRQNGAMQIKENFAALQDWREGLAILSAYYRTHGTGLFGQYHSFRWLSKGKEDGELAGIKYPDPVSFSSLFEYEEEQKKVIENTEQFLAGYPANNVLLYGERGTGKSSTVKALVNRYGIKGLRLIEIQKQDLDDFPLIIEKLVGRPQKFILFIDDLSFSSEEGQYRELKALLEGSLAKKPDNVLVYATSNRRHLIQESFADRQNDNGYKQTADDDVRLMDTIQEKFSLADRFGITVTFTSPDQERYLKIVEKLAAERRLAIGREELRQSALKWELRFNARSARTAKQFIDYLEGKLGLKEG